MNRWVKLLFIVLAFGLMGNQSDCKLDEKLKDLLSGAFDPGAGKAKVHISYLSFLDTESRTVMNAGDADLINKAVEEGMSTLAAQDKKYVINAQGHRVENTDANAVKLNTIFWDPNITPKDKIDKIVSELLEPNNVDGLVSGQFTEKATGEINIRPFVISRKSKQLVTESRNFTKGEFKCPDPQDPNRSILCQTSHEDIKDTVIRLLKTF